jgi:hypothetical protein
MVEATEVSRGEDDRGEPFRIGKFEGRVWSGLGIYVVTSLDGIDIGDSQIVLIKETRPEITRALPNDNADVALKALDYGWTVAVAHDRGKLLARRGGKGFSNIYTIDRKREAVIRVEEDFLERDLPKGLVICPTDGGLVLLHPNEIKDNKTAVTLRSGWEALRNRAVIEGNRQYYASIGMNR